MVNHELLKDKIVGPLPLGTVVSRTDQARARLRHRNDDARRHRAIGTRHHARTRAAGSIISATRKRKHDKDTVSHKIKKATRHTNQNEGLIFEKSSPGKRAFELPPLDVPAVDPAQGSRRKSSRRRREGFPRSQRNRSDPPLHAPLDVELRHRPRHVSARFLHDEVQPARERIRRAPRRHRHRTSGSAARAFARLPQNSATARKLPARNHGHGHASRCNPQPARKANSPACF